MAKKGKVYCINCSSFDNFHGEHHSCWEKRVKYKSPIYLFEKGEWNGPRDPYVQNKNNDCKYFEERK
jgi:hypothetical protein